MKMKNLGLFLCASLSILLTGCKNDDNNDGPIGNGPGNGNANNDNPGSYSLDFEGGDFDGQTLEGNFSGGAFYGAGTYTSMEEGIFDFNLLKLEASDVSNTPQIISTEGSFFLTNNNTDLLPLGTENETDSTSLMSVSIGGNGDNSYFFSSISGEDSISNLEIGEEAYGYVQATYDIEFSGMFYDIYTNDTVNISGIISIE